MRVASLSVWILIVGCTSASIDAKKMSFEEFRLSRELAVFIDGGGDVNEKSPATSHTPLTDALNNGHENLALMLIEHGAKFDVDEGWGMTAFHEAIIKGSEKLVRAMLENGADPNLCAADLTPLALAVSNSRTEPHYLDIIRLLLAHKADPNKAPFMARIASHDGPEKPVNPRWPSPPGSGRPQEYVFPPLWIAANLGFVDVARLLLEAGSKTEFGPLVSPLERAVIGEHAGVVELLLNRGARADAKLLDGEWYNQATLLHAAAAKGNLKIVQLLVEKGADINAKDGDGKTPLNSAEEGKFGPMPIDENEVAVIVRSKDSSEKNQERPKKVPSKAPPDTAHKAVIDYLRAHGAKQ